MRKTRLILPLLIAALMLAACSFPGDKPAKRWIKFLNKHAALVTDGEFSADDFRRQGKPIAEDLAKRIDERNGKILLSDDIRERFHKANEDFLNACDEADNTEAVAAFRDVADAFADFEKAKD